MLQLLFSNWPIVLIIVVLIIAILIGQLLGRREAMPYDRRPSLMTRSEVHFYHVLVEAVGDDWTVFSKVRISDLLQVRKGTKKYLSWLNRINQKHVDFVICDPETLVPAAAIELDDPSHNRPDRIKRDVFVNEAFLCANLPLIRMPTQRDYVSRQIRKQIDASIPR